MSVVYVVVKDNFCEFGPPLRVCTSEELVNTYIQQQFAKQEKEHGFRVHGFLVSAFVVDGEQVGSIKLIEKGS